MVQRHSHVAGSNAHFLPLQGRQQGLGEGDGEREAAVGGGDGGVGGEDGGGRVRGAGVLDERGMEDECGWLQNLFIYLLLVIT